MAGILKVNSIESAATNGNITLDPDGTGNTIISSGNVGIGVSSPVELNEAGFRELIIGGATEGAGITLKDADANVKLGMFCSDASNTGVLRTITNHPLAFRTDNTERMRINGNGFVGIGYTSSASDWSSAMKVHIEGSKALIVKSTGGSGEEVMAVWNTGTSGTRNQILFADGAGSVRGSITTNGSSTSYNTSSDYRLKENVSDMTGAITRLKTLQPKRFNFIDDSDDTVVDGFLAHEVTAVPEAVVGTHNEVDDDGNAVMQSIDQSKLVPLLVGALKESIAKIETLEAKVAALEE